MNVKELVKNKYYFLLFILLFQGCEDKSYITQVYDKKLLAQPITCLKLKLTPYSNEVYETTKEFYNFTNDCDTTLEIRYKTQIACNSPYNTNKNLNSFIEFDILNKDKLVYTLYKDLSTQNLKDELQKGYKQLCKKINLP